jgi:hypothetical protein
MTRMHASHDAMRRQEYTRAILPVVYECASALLCVECAMRGARRTRTVVRRCQHHRRSVTRTVPHTHVNRMRMPLLFLLHSARTRTYGTECALRRSLRGTRSRTHGGKSINATPQCQPCTLVNASEPDEPMYQFLIDSACGTHTHANGWNAMVNA